MLIRMLKGLLGSGQRSTPAANPAATGLLTRLDALCDSLRQGDQARAAQIAATTLTAASKNPVALGALARAGGLDDAMRRYAEITAAKVERQFAARAWEELAYCHSLRGNLDESVRAFEEALKLDHGADAELGAFNDLYHRGLAVTQTWNSPRRRRRFFHLVGLVEQCAQLDGECAECGCWRGLSSFLICSTLQRLDTSFDGRGYHIFDSFEGLSEPKPEDRGTGQASMFSASLEEVRANLARFPSIAFHPGWIPESFAGLPERRYRFVHVDVDLFEPTDGAVRYFVPRLVRGGVLVCDDFDWPGARKAIEDYCAARGLSFSTTDSNQAVIRA